MIRLFLLALVLACPVIAVAEEVSLVPRLQSDSKADRENPLAGTRQSQANPEPSTVGAVGQTSAIAADLSEYEPFTSPKGGFSLSYPADWLRVEHPSMAFQVRPSLDSLFVLRVQVSKAPKRATAESYAKAQIKRFGKFWEPEIEEAAVLGGADAWRLRHVQMIEGRMTRAEKLFAIKGGRAFMLDCQTNPSSFPALESICAAVAASFEFTGG